MEITEVRIKLVENASERLRAFCSVTLDGDFVIRDLKIIDGTSGAFVAMPSRKLMDRCSRCGSKNHLRARFCNDCGNRLNENRAPKDAHGRAKLHADVAHPINAACRERVQKAVVEAYHAELERAKSPDYKPPQYDDYDDYAEEPADMGRSSTPFPPAAPRETKASHVPASKTDDQFDDYNELIADLKRDARNRRQDRGGQDIPMSPSVGAETRNNAVVRAEENTSAAPSAPWREEGTGSEPSEPAPPPPDDDFGAGL